MKRHMFQVRRERPDSGHDVQQAAARPMPLDVSSGADVNVCNVQYILCGPVAVASSFGSLVRLSCLTSSSGKMPTYQVSAAGHGLAAIFC